MSLLNTDSKKVHNENYFIISVVSLITIFDPFLKVFVAKNNISKSRLNLCYSRIFFSVTVFVMSVYFQIQSVYLSFEEEVLSYSFFLIVFSAIMKFFVTVLYAIEYFPFYYRFIRSIPNSLIIVKKFLLLSLIHLSVFASILYFSIGGSISQLKFNIDSFKSTTFNPLYFNFNDFLNSLVSLLVMYQRQSWMLVIQNIVDSELGSKALFAVIFFLIVSHFIIIPVFYVNFGRVIYRGLLLNIQRKSKID